jgi:hypothetical protein
MQFNAHGIRRAGSIQEFNQRAGGASDLKDRLRRSAKPSQDLLHSVLRGRDNHVAFLLFGGLSDVAFCHECDVLARPWRRHAEATAPARYDLEWNRLSINGEEAELPLADRVELATAAQANRCGRGGD